MPLDAFSRAAPSTRSLPIYYTRFGDFAYPQSNSLRKSEQASHNEPLPEDAISIRNSSATTVPASTFGAMLFN